MLLQADRARARRPSVHMLFAGLHFAADSFSFAENAEDITAQNLADIVGAVTAIEEGLRDFWQVAAGVDAFGGRAAYAVTIRPQPPLIAPPTLPPTPAP